MPRSQISTVPAPYWPAGIVALEVRVLERVVLDVHREMTLSAPERDALRHGPARERTVALEPEVVVEPPRRVPLDDEPRPLALASDASERLRRLPRTALAPVLVEAHLWIVARSATLSLPTAARCALFPAQTAFAAGDKPVERVENRQNG